MKKITRRLTALLLTAIMLFACVPAFPVSAASYKNFKKGDCLVVTAPHGVNMHADPSVSATRILILACGSHVTVNSVRTNGWMNVTCNDIYTGWVEGSEGWFDVYNDMPEEYAYTNKQAVVLANVLNVHKTPVQLTTNILDDLAKGQAVDAIGYTANGWTKVSYYRGQNQIVGYVSSMWVRLVDKAADNTAVYTTAEEFTEIYGWSAKVNNNCSALKVHNSPSVNATQIATLYKGDIVNILAESAHWYRISIVCNGRATNGYIYKSLTSVIDAMENFRLSNTSLKLGKGQQYQLLVRGNTTGWTPKIVWKSSNKKVAKVNKYGIIKAKKKGSAVITCTITIGNQTEELSCNVKVKKGNVAVL